METQTLKRRDRFDRRARTTKDGKRVNSDVTHRDITKIYPVLLRYRALPTNYIHKLVGGDYQSLRKHMSKQALAPHFYLNLPSAQFDKRNADYNYFIWELGAGGLEIMKTRGHKIPLRLPLRNLDHKLLECIFEASIELGMIENLTISRIEWDEIRLHLPEATKRLDDPLKIPVFKDHYIKPDGYPFALSYDNKAFRFIVFEADCDTESGKSTEYTNTIQFKVEAYLHILQKHIYTTHFGAETFMAFFITTNAGREREILNIIEMVMKEQKYPLDLARGIAVSHTQLYRTLIDLETPEPPSGHMLTRAWKRACGLPDFHLDQP